MTTQEEKVKQRQVKALFANKISVATRPTCPICRKAFSSKTNMRLHVDTVHGANKFLCPMCPTSFTRKFSLQRHLITAHSYNDSSSDYSDFRT